MIQELINKSDSFEIIRDAIANIFASEFARQYVLSGNNPLYKFKVFTDRFTPWEDYLGESSERTPIVNVWFSNDSDDPRAGNVVEQQRYTGIFNIDCYGVADAENTLQGHMPSDLAAAHTVHRAARMARNIIMASDYTYLGLRGLVSSRMVKSRTIFQPSMQDQIALPGIVGCRLALQVVYNEFSPQYQGQIMEQVGVGITRSETGEVYLSAQYEV